MSKDWVFHEVINEVTSVKGFYERHWRNQIDNMIKEITDKEDEEFLRSMLVLVRSSDKV